MTFKRTPSVRTVEERNALVEQWSGLPSFVLNRLLRGDRLVIRYRHECRSAADLALLRAAELWREDGGAKFNTYAVAAILSMVRREAGRQARLHARERPSPSVFRIADERSCERLRRLPELEGEEQLPQALACLTPKQRSVVEALYGLDGSEPRSLPEVAAAFGVSKGRVWQVEHEALCRMLRRLAAPAA